VLRLRVSYQRLASTVFALLLLAACDPKVISEGAGAGGPSGNAASGTGGSGTTGGPGGAASGPIPGACVPPVAAPDSPGIYSFAINGNEEKYVLFKRDDANDRCMLLNVRLGAGAAYGLQPSSDYGIEAVVLTNAASDCPVTYAETFPTPTGQTVEASCGTGSFLVEAAENSIEGQIVHAIFEFPQSYPWVPASDTYCVIQNCCGAPMVSGC
jgi:hypothetical protein